MGKNREEEFAFSWPKGRGKSSNSSPYFRSRLQPAAMGACGVVVWAPLLAGLVWLWVQPGLWWADFHHPVNDRSVDSKGSFKLLHLKSRQLSFTVLEGTPRVWNGEVVWCLHGFPDDHTTFESSSSLLVEAGYKVYSQLLRGYEESSQPEPSVSSAYVVTRIINDTVGLWDNDALGLKGRQIHIIGHDWGCVALQFLPSYVARMRVKTASCLAIPPLSAMGEAIEAIPSQLRNSWYMLFFQLPSPIPRLWLLNSGMLKLWHDWSNGVFSYARYQSVFNTLSKPGVASAAVQYYKDNIPLMQLAGDLRRRAPDSRGLAIEKTLLGYDQYMRCDASRALIESVLEDRVWEVPFLFIGGDRDGCMSPAVFTRACDLAKKQPDFRRHGMSCHMLPGAGHWPHHTSPRRVYRLLVSHFEAPSTA